MCRRSDYGRLFHRWVSELYGTVHFTPVPPSMWADPISWRFVRDADVPREILPAGDYEIVAPVGCHAAGVLRRKVSG